MKTTATIMAFCLLFGNLFPRTDFGQLSHLLEIADHYQAHVKQAELKGEAFSLHEFLCIHFIHPENHEQHGGDDNHSQVPCQCSAPSTIVLAMAETVEPAPPVFDEINGSTHAYRNLFHLSGNPAIIDLPPEA